ncbi:hypothetical protein EDB83DRAFT_2553804 [Lactarius deliciosus]|nr:hypothetical protein EDB83DRAFT_2553804 [Lactarius deliciosus]
MPLQILGPIRNIYIALHQDTLSAPTQFSTSTNNWDDTLRVPSSYPLCSVAGHICCDVVSATSAAALPPTSPASSDAHHSSVLAPVHVVESLTGVPPLDNFHRDPAHQTTIESVRIHVSSLDPATSNTTMPQLAPQASPSTPLSFTSPPVAVALQHNPDLLAPSDAPNLSSVAASNPVLGNIRPTELYGSMTAITTPSAAPGPTSAPCLGAATKDDGSPKPVSRKGTDTLGPSR